MTGHSRAIAAEPPRDLAPPVASDVVAACEDAWRAIQRHHADLPDVVVVLGTGVERGRLVKLGHWWGGRWIADGNIRGEVLLAGEALHLSPHHVFEVLLHEAAHGLNAARGVKDSSRGGRYHNARFKATAEEVGLAVAMMPPHGWARTNLQPSATARYASEIGRLGEAMRIARRLSADVQVGELGDDKHDGQDHRDAGGSGRAKPRPATCGCGRRMRMAPSVLAQGPVVCGVCGQDFTIETSAQHRATETRAAHPYVEHTNRDHDAVDRETPQLKSLQHQACESLKRLAATPEGVGLLIEAAAWCAAHRDGEPRVLLASTVEETEAMNDAVRSLLKVDGTLTGPAAHVGERDFLVGELVMMREHDTSAADVDDNALPPVGALGKIERIDPIGTLDIDFPAFGRQRVDIASGAARAITYGYAETSEFAASLIDLRTVTDLTATPTSMAALEIELA